MTTKRNKCGIASVLFLRMLIKIRIVFQGSRHAFLNKEIKMLREYKKEKKS
jgi:hypothetical protein